MPKWAVEKQYYEMPELVGFQTMVWPLMLWVSLVWTFTFYLNPTHHTVRLGSINVPQTWNWAVFSKTTLSCSKTYPVARKNPPQAKVVIIKYGGALNTMKNLFYVCFWYDHFFRSKGYLFGYKSVILDNSALFYVCG